MDEVHTYSRAIAALPPAAGSDYLPVVYPCTSTAATTLATTAAAGSDYLPVVYPCTSTAATILATTAAAGSDYLPVVYPRTTPPALSAHCRFKAMRPRRDLPTFGT